MDKSSTPGLFGGPTKKEKAKEAEIKAKVAVKKIEKKQVESSIASAVRSPTKQVDVANHLRKVRDAALQHEDFKQTRS